MREQASLEMTFYIGQHAVDPRRWETIQGAKWAGIFRFSGVGR